MLQSTDWLSQLAIILMSMRWISIHSCGNHTEFMTLDGECMDYEQISLTSQVKNGFHCISFHDTTTQWHYMEISCAECQEIQSVNMRSTTESPLTTVITAQLSAGRFSRKSRSLDYHMYGTLHTDSNNSDAQFSLSYCVTDGHCFRLLPSK